MAISNGYLSTSLLSEVPGETGKYLRSPAASSWGRVRAQVRQRYGWTPTLSDGWTAYRSYAQQRSIFLDYYSRDFIAGRPTAVWLGHTWWRRLGKPSCAVPGTSNHGLGLAVDVRGLGDFDSKRFLEFAIVAQANGWNNREGAAIGEPWHWNYDPEKDKGATMALDASDAATVWKTEIDGMTDDQGDGEQTISGATGLRRLLIMARQARDSLAAILASLGRIEKAIGALPTSTGGTVSAAVVRKAVDEALDERLRRALGGSA